MPAALRSKSEATTTTPASLAILPKSSVLGPGIASARSKSCASSRWQKYCVRKSSCRQTICAPILAASRTLATAFSTFAAASVLHDICTSPSRNGDAVISYRIGLAAPAVERVVSRSAAGVSAALSLRLLEVGEKSGGAVAASAVALVLADGLEHPDLVGRRAPTEDARLERRPRLGLTVAPLQGEIVRLATRLICRWLLATAPSGGPGIGRQRRLAGSGR